MNININYILSFTCLGLHFVGEKNFWNFTIIYKSYKFYDVTFTGEICLFIKIIDG